MGTILDLNQDREDSETMSNSLERQQRFERKMSQVREVTGAADKDFDRLTTKAKELGETTSFSAREVADGMKFLGQAGFTTEQILAGVPAVLDLAKSCLIDPGKAADIASNLCNKFSIAAADISRVADVMFETVTSTSITIEELNESFYFLHQGLITDSNQSMEEMAAVFGILASCGIKRLTASSDLERILETFLMRPDYDNPETLLFQPGPNPIENFGVPISYSTGKIRRISGVMRDFNVLLKPLAWEEQLAQLSTIFGVAYRSAFALISNMKYFDNVLARIEHSSGAASSMAKIMIDNEKGALE